MDFLVIDAVMSRRSVIDSDSKMLIFIIKERLFNGNVESNLNETKETNVLAVDKVETVGHQPINSTEICSSSDRLFQNQRRKYHLEGKSVGGILDDDVDVGSLVDYLQDIKVFNII